MFYNSCSCRRRGRITHEVNLRCREKTRVQDCLLACSSQRTGVFRTRRRAKWPTPNRRKWIRFKLALTLSLPLPPVADVALLNEVSDEHKIRITHSPFLPSYTAQNRPYERRPDFSVSNVEQDTKWSAVQKGPDKRRNRKHGY